jgi:hypothetical protein
MSASQNDKRALDTLGARGEPSAGASDICPECASNRAGEQNGELRCADCGYEFAFKLERDGMSDSAWRQLLERASHDRSSRDGSTHDDASHDHASDGAGSELDADELFDNYAEDRARLVQRFGKQAIIGAILSPIGLACWVFSLRGDHPLSLSLGILTALAGLGLLLSGIGIRRQPPPREPFQRWVEQWRQRGRSLSGRGSMRGVKD